MPSVLGDDLLGISKKRWRRADDPIQSRQPEYAFGSLAEFNYQTKHDREARSPGPVYLPKSSNVLDAAPDYSISSLAPREYDHKHRNTARSPGPIYKPSTGYTSQNTMKQGYMGTLASRDYDDKVLYSQKSPGPVYNPKKNATSDKPPSSAYSISIRHEQRSNHRSKSPGPNFYTPDDAYTSKNARKGGVIGTLASRDYQCKNVDTSKSPGPIYRPKENCTSRAPPPRSASFGRRFKYSDQIEKEKLIAGPGSYTPEIIPRFKRKKRKGKRT